MTIEKILLVDDDRNIQMIAQMGLEDRPDWNIILASSGAEALDKYEKEKPDLVLLDLMMPGMDGETTYARLKELSIGKAVPVVFMTAKVQQHEIESYLNLGIAGVIAKPFDPMTLSMEICKVLGIN